VEFKTYIPHIALQPYVQAIGYARMNSQTPGKQHRIDLFPTGYSVLNFTLCDPCHLVDSGKTKGLDRFNFAGQMNKHQFLVASQIFMVFVLLRPYGAYRLLGIPQDLLKNECPSLNTLLGPNINELVHKMEDNGDNHYAVLQLLQEWLLKQLNQNANRQTDRVSFICEQIMQHNGALPIQELNRVSGMSKRSMEQHFKEQVGLSPKTFSRIIRFNQVHKQLQSSHTMDWMDIVAQFDYFDQSHFIHEFRNFFGYTPSQKHLSTQNISQQVSSIIFG
jgi:AraC-like DNA-binding protein